MAETEPSQMVTTVDYDVFRERRQDASVVVVDTLPPTSYAHSHIPGAISLPLADIGDRAHRVLPDKSQEIIVYCAGYT